MDTINFDTLTTYDMVVLGIFLALILRGLWFGALRQITGLVALYGAYFAASQYHQQILPMLTGLSDNPRVIFLAACAILFVATYLIVLLIGRLLRLVIDIALAGWFDRFLGGVIGGMEAVIITVILHLILGAVTSPDNESVRNCLTCTALNPAAEFTRNLIRNPEARASLIQKTPAIEDVKERIDAAFNAPDTQDKQDGAKAAKKTEKEEASPKKE